MATVNLACARKTSGRRLKATSGGARRRAAPSARGIWVCAGGMTMPVMACKMAARTSRACVGRRASQSQPSTTDNAARPVARYQTGTQVSASRCAISTGPEYARRSVHSSTAKSGHPRRSVQSPHTKDHARRGQGPTARGRGARAVLVARLVALPRQSRWALPHARRPSGSSAIVASSGVCSSTARPRLIQSRTGRSRAPSLARQPPTHLTTPLAITCSPRHSRPLAHIPPRRPPRRASGFAR